MDFTLQRIEVNTYSFALTGKTLVLADKFPVSNGDKIIISIDKTNSETKQGLSVDITGECEYLGQRFHKGKGVKMLFWEDTAPRRMELTITTKADFIWIQNIWESKTHQEIPYTDFGRYGAAMIVEEIEGGRRYCCNDWHPDENFDDIVFTVRKVGNILDEKKEK